MSTRVAISRDISAGDDSETSTHREAKPRLRGVSHQIAVFAFFVASAALLTTVQSHACRIAVLIYGASACLMFGTSAIYHRGRWSEKATRHIQRVDHSAIFVMIAGSYTPLFMLLPPDDYAGRPLMMVWLLATLGVLKALVWADSPNWITAMLAIAIGWYGVVHVPALAAAMGDTALVLLVSAGVIYTLGGVVFALKRPDPLPKVFGYHEVFHAFVIAGCVTHFAHVVLIVRATDAMG